jgi:hypothetical protein
MSSYHPEKTIGSLLTHSWWMSQWLMTAMYVPLNVQTKNSHTYRPPQVLLSLTIPWTMQSESRYDIIVRYTRIDLTPSSSCQSSWALRVVSMMTFHVCFSCILIEKPVFWPENYLPVHHKWCRRLVRTRHHTSAYVGTHQQTRGVTERASQAGCSFCHSSQDTSASKKQKTFPLSLSGTWYVFI